MTPQECAAALTYANQIDPRIQLNDAALDVWETALSHADPEQVRWVIRNHYASGVNANEGSQPMLTAAMVRRALSEETNRAAAKRSALEAPVHRQELGAGPAREIGRRLEDPAFMREVVAGAVERLEDLERRELIDPAGQKRLDHYRRTGEFHGIDGATSREIPA